MATAGAGAFLANSLGVAVTSALSYWWTAAVIRSRPKPNTWSTPDDLDVDACDLWLHECAASSADGTFTRARENICKMAAPERCSAYFEGMTRNPPSPSRLWSSFRKRRGPITLAGSSSSTRNVELASGVTVTGKHRPSASAGLGVPHLGVLLGWNTLGWISAYLVCGAVKKARARGLRPAPFPNGAARMNPVGVGGNDDAGGVVMVAVENDPVVVADGAGGGDAAGVGGPDAENAAGVEGLQQAPVAPGSVKPHDGSPNADTANPAIGGNNNNGNNNEPGDDNSNKNPAGIGSSVKPGGGSPADLGSGLPLSAPVCDVSPHRTPSRSRPRFLKGISSAAKGNSTVRSRSQTDIGGTAREMSCEYLNRRHSAPLAIGEGKAGKGSRRFTAQAGCDRRFDSPVALTALSALSPGLASPPKLRRAKPSGILSAAQVDSNQSCPSATSPSGGKGVSPSDLGMVPANTNEGVSRRPSPGNSSGGAKLTGEDRGSDEGGDLGRSSSTPTPSSLPPGSGLAAAAPASSEAKASGESSSQDGGDTEDPVGCNGAAHLLRMRPSAAERELGNLIGLRSPNPSAPANSPVSSPEAGSTPSTAPVSDTPASEAHVSDGPASQVGDSDASDPGTPAPDIPGSLASFPGTLSSTYSACWTVLPEGFTKSTSLRGLSDLDVDVAYSASWVGAVTMETDGGNGGSPHNGYMVSSHDILEGGVEESKGGSVESCASSAPQIGIEVDRVGFDAFLLTDSDDGHARSVGISGCVAEEKGQSACQISSAKTERELETPSRSDGIGGCIPEGKGQSACQISSTEAERQLKAHVRLDHIEDGGVGEEKVASACAISSTGAHVRSDGIAGGSAEEKGVFACQMSSAKPKQELKDQAHSDGIVGGVTAEKGSPAYQMSSVETERELETHARADSIGGGIAEEKRPPACQISSAEKERETAAHERSDHRGGGIIGEKGLPACQVSSAKTERKLETHARADGIGGGVAEQKGPPDCQISSAEKERETSAHARSDHLGGGVSEEKGSTACQVSSAETERELETHARADGIGGGIAEEKGPPACQMSSAEPKGEPEAQARSDNTRGGVVEWKGPPDYPMYSQQEIEAHARSDRIEGGVAEEKGPSTNVSISWFDLLANLTQSVQQALMPSGFLPPSDRDPNADRDLATGNCSDNRGRKPGDNNSNNKHNDNNSKPDDNNSNTKPGRSSSVSPGGGPSADLKPCSAVSPGSPLSVTLCDVSPGRVTPSPSTSRPPVPQDNSGATNGESPGRSRSQSGIGGKVREVSGKGLNRGHSTPFAIGEGMAETERRGFTVQIKGSRIFTSVAAVSALAASPPGLALPLNLRSAKPSSVPSAVHVTANQVSPPSNNRSGDKDVTTSGLNNVSATTNEGVTRRSSPTNSSGDVKPTREDGGSDKGGERDSSLEPPAPRSPPAASSSAPSGPTCSETKAPGEGSRQEGGDTEDPSGSNAASNRLATRFSDAGRKLTNILGPGLPNGFAPAEPPVAGPEMDSTPSSASGSDAPASGKPISAGTASRARTSGSRVSDIPALDTPGSDESAPDPYSSPSSPSSTHSACWTVLRDVVTKSISLRGLSGLEVDGASPARPGHTVTMDKHGDNDGSPHNGQMTSGHGILQGGVEESKGGRFEPRASWAPPIGINVDRLEFYSSLLTDSDDEGHPCSFGIGGGVAGEKVESACQMSSDKPARELAFRARWEHCGDDFFEEEWPSACQLSSAKMYRDREARARSDRIEGVGGVGEETGASAYQISLAERKRKLAAHARSDGIGGGVAEGSGASAYPMSAAEKERELKMALGLIPASPNAHPTLESEAPPSPTSPSEPRWGNMSTRVPLEERCRRNQELFEAVQRRRETGTDDEERGEAQPAAFPDESGWPSGDGYAEPEGPGDRLPPPSDYEVQEVARMNAIRDEAMREFGLEF